MGLWIISAEIHALKMESSSTWAHCEKADKTRNMDYRRKIKRGPQI